MTKFNLIYIPSINLRLVVAMSANYHSDGLLGEDYKLRPTKFFWFLSKDLMNAIILKNMYNFLEISGIGLKLKIDDNFLQSKN